MESSELKSTLSKIAALCSRKEMCVYDVEKKLKAWDVNPDLYADVVDYLTENKFLDEERYARFFANDKYKYNKWGRGKIRYMLSQKGLSSAVVQEALSEIDEEEYFRIMKNEIQKKAKSLKETDKYKKRAKIFSFAASRGIEQELTNHILDEVLVDEE